MDDELPTRRKFAIHWPEYIDDALFAQRMPKEKKVLEYYCSTCRITLSGQKVIKAHLGSGQHVRKQITRFIDESRVVRCISTRGRWAIKILPMETGEWHYVKCARRRPWSSLFDFLLDGRYLSPGPIRSHFFTNRSLIISQCHRTSFHPTAKPFKPCRWMVTVKFCIKASSNRSCFWET